MCIFSVKCMANDLDSKFALLNSLFVAKTKHADTNKYSYFGWYGIGFDAHGAFTLSDNSGFGRNVIIFGFDNSSSKRAGNKKRY